MDTLSARFSQGEDVLDRIERRLSSLQDSKLEGRYERNLGNWFRRYVRNPRRVLIDGLERLVEAESEGRLTDAQMERLEALDLLVMGRERTSDEDLLLAVELSHTVALHDVERAAAAVELLESVGYVARPFVGGYRITEVAHDVARAQGVIIDLHRPPEEPDEAHV